MLSTARHMVLASMSTNVLANGRAKLTPSRWIVRVGKVGDVSLLVLKQVLSPELEVVVGYVTWALYACSITSHPRTRIKNKGIYIANHYFQICPKSAMSMNSQIYKRF